MTHTVMLQVLIASDHCYSRETAVYSPTPYCHIKRVARFYSSAKNKQNKKQQRADTWLQKNGSVGYKQVKHGDEMNWN